MSTLKTIKLLLTDREDYKNRDQGMDELLSAINTKENNMKLEELNGVNESAAIEELTEPFNLEGLGSADTEDEELMQIQGLLGNVAIVDEDEESIERSDLFPDISIGDAPVVGGDS